MAIVTNRYRLLSALLFLDHASHEMVVKQIGRRQREQARDIFGLEDPIVVTVINDGPEGIFNPASLALIDDLTQEIAKLPNIRFPAKIMIAGIFSQLTDGVIDRKDGCMFDKCVIEF